MPVTEKVLAGLSIALVDPMPVGTDMKMRDTVLFALELYEHPQVTRRKLETLSAG